MDLYVLLLSQRNHRHRGGSYNRYIEIWNKSYIVKLDVLVLLRAPGLLSGEGDSPLPLQQARYTTQAKDSMVTRTENYIPH